jgi:hypothetical protein
VGWVIFSATGAVSGIHCRASIIRSDRHRLLCAGTSNS